MARVTVDEMTTAIVDVLELVVGPIKQQLKAQEDRLLELEAQTFAGKRDGVMRDD